MVGGHHLHPGGVSALNDGLDNLVAGEGLHVHQVHIPGLGGLDVQLGIGLGLNGLLAALLGGAEGEQQGNLAQDLPQALEHVQHLGEVEHALEPVHTPLHHVHGDGVEGLGLGKDVLFGHAHDGHTNLGNSSSNLNISHANSIHSKAPIFNLKLILCID